MNVGFDDEDLPINDNVVLDDEINVDLNAPIPLIDIPISLIANENLRAHLSTNSKESGGSSVLLSWPARCALGCFESWLDVGWFVRWCFCGVLLVLLLGCFRGELLYCCGDLLATCYRMALFVCSLAGASS
ncbi:hypothetical protein KFK09_006652 [Dendrobium nobile]|uniref:Uncharacterized protein n=1 Tax=Dendrobium nobile TaxID=94219 RepID=A0A8T3BRX8_DENNO|nr:hypothetical protein KFK09_006652 [Dendrobium nobile]